MSLALKVKVVKTGQTKVMMFSPGMSVAEACNSIVEKGVEGGAAFGLFQAAGPKNPPRWLRADRTLQFYDLNTNDELEYKQRQRPIKIKLLDQTIKTVLIDDTLSVFDIVAFLGEKMSISNVDEYSLKIDGKTEWLNSTQSLNEQSVPDDAVILIEKKFFVTDATLSTEDPLTLHLVYIQCRDSILAGKHPMTEDEALTFGALQCQILYGNYDPNKNKVLELDKLIPPSLHKSKKIDERLVKEHKKLIGMSDINAKYRYVQQCRGLKTYGITFFKCRLRPSEKTKKKAKPMQLGITRDAIIFMDDETREITKEIRLAHLRRWAPAPTTITLDFGDHDSEYSIMETSEGEAISALIAGYIDILMRRKKEGTVNINNPNEMVADLEPVAPISSTAFTSVTMSTIRGMNGTTAGGMSNMATQMLGRTQFGAGMALPTNLGGAQSYVGSLINDLRGGSGFARNAQLTPQQWRNQLIRNADAVLSSCGKLSAVMPPNRFDKNGVDSKAAEIATNLAQLISAARNAAFKANGDEDVDLLNGAKRVADSIRDLLGAARELAEHPNDPKYIERFLAAQRALQAATSYLMAANKNNLADDPSQELLLMSAKNIAAAVEELLSTARNKNENNPGVNQWIDVSKRADEELQAQALALAPSILDAGSQRQLQDAAMALQNAISKLLGIASTTGDATGLDLAAKNISDAIAQMLSASKLAEPMNKLPDFSMAAKEVLDECQKLMNAFGNPGQINQSTKLIAAGSAKIAQGARDAALVVDDEQKERLLSFVKNVAAGTQRLIQTAQMAASEPTDQNAHRALQEACQRLSEAIRSLVGDAVERAAMRNLQLAAKSAAAATSSLIAASRTAAMTCADDGTTETLKKNANLASDALGAMIKSLEAAWNAPDDQRLQDALVKDTHNTAPQAYKLVAAAKAALPKITDFNNKNNLRQTADEAAEALQKLVSANKAVLHTSGQATIELALERFAAEEAGLDAAIVDVDSGAMVVDPNQTSEGAAQLLNIAARQIAGCIKTMATTAKSNPDELGEVASQVADAVSQTNNAARVLASTIADPISQRQILVSAKELTIQARNALGTARSVAANPADPSLTGLLQQSARTLAEALANLLNVAKGVSASTKECEDAIASIIAAMDAITPKTGNPKDYPVYVEDLENCIKAIQSATSALVTAARNNPKTVGNAAKTVAMTVTPMITASNAASGTAKAEVQRNIVVATKESAKDITELINTARLANRDNSDALEVAANKVAASLERLLGALNATPAQRQFSDSIEEILHATAKLNTHYEAGSGDLSAAIEAIKGGTTKLGDATRGIIGSSRTEPDQMAVWSKEAATAVSILIDASLDLSNSSRVSLFAEAGEKLKLAAAELVNVSGSADASVRQGTVKAAKEVTMATQALSEQVRTEANKSANQNAIQVLMNATQAIANATQSLVNAAKTAASGDPEARDVLEDARDSLDAAVDSLVTADPGQAHTPNSQKLITVARGAASSTTAMIELARSVHKKPNDNKAVAELSASARAVGAAIKGLLDASKAIGEIDLEESINEVTLAISELDQATISATVGLLDNSANGKSSQQLEEDLIEQSRTLAGAIKSIISAQDSPINLAKAARATASMVPGLANTAIALASISTDSESQQNGLNSVKAIADSTLMLISACKENDVGEIAVQSKESSRAIAVLLGSLKGGVLAQRECDEAAKAVLEAGKGLDTVNINMAIDKSKSYADSQRELTNLTRELTANIANMVKSAKDSPVEVGEHARRVASIIPAFVQHTRDAISTISEIEIRKPLLESARNVVGTSEKLIKASKTMSSDNKNVKTQQLISATYKEMSDSISQLSVAIKKGATGEIKCEEAIENINRRIGEIDGAALFAATGQLQKEGGEVELDEVQKNIDANAQRINEAMKRMIAAAPRDQRELGVTATEASDAFDNVVKDSRILASQITNLLTQQEILMAAKGVGITIQLAVTSSLNVNKNPDNAQLREALNEGGQRVADAITDLTTQTLQASASSGVKNLDNAKKAIQQALSEIAGSAGNRNAGAADILKAAKTLADAIATVSTAGPDDGVKVVQAANDIATAASSLVFDSKGAGRLIDPQSAKRLFEAAYKTSQATAVFLEAAKVHRRVGNQETQMRISEANDELVKVIAELVESTRPLPGSEEALKLFQETDELEALAEQELLNAASIIEEAARTLMEAKRKQLEMRRNKDSPLPDEEINEAIIDAARAITAATATLVGAATQVQKELAVKGRAERKENVYRRDPAWAKGLISAAQSVAGSVKGLVGAANGAVSGRAEEEALVASAKSVAAATARLVYASRTKADPFSPTQQNLSNAAKLVAVATKKLVDAARNAKQLVTEDTEAKPNWEGLGETAQKKLEIEAQTKILKLQKDLEGAQKQLLDMRKKEYQDATGKTPATKSAAAAPVKSSSTAPRVGGPARTNAARPKKLLPGEKVFSYDMLRSKPAECDPSMLEKYLSDDEFVQVFNMPKAAFEKLPEWKRQSQKKQLGLL